MITLEQRATALGLYGLLANWSAASQSDWLSQVIDWEEQARTQRSLERRIKEAKLGRFKHLADFDWSWTQHNHRQHFEELMQLEFISRTANIILQGPNGVGKTTLVKNLAHEALLRGHTVRFTTAGELLGELAALDSDSALRRRLQYYAGPQVLVIDEMGYLSYSNRHADLLFELVNRRYERKSTLITTNKPFANWSEVFPNAACVVSLIDRLIHHAEVIPIEGDSYRLKEAKERAEQRQKKR
jgi:DNA replication protein DnaC